jgi:ribosome-binding factor A
MSRAEQINDLLRAKLAGLITREIHLNNGLITVVEVSTDNNLSEAKISVSILPFNLSGNIIKILRKHSSRFSQILRKETKLRRIPKFNWVIDDTEKKAAEIDEVFKKIS